MSFVENGKRILESEKQAHLASDAAEKELLELDEALAKQREHMELDYRSRADKRLEQISASEYEFAEISISELDEQYDKDVRETEESKEKNSERWVKTLYDLIIEYPLKD